MEIGLMSEVFKVFLGNATVMAVLITWAVFITLLFTVISVFKETEL